MTHNQATCIEDLSIIPTLRIERNKSFDRVVAWNAHPDMLPKLEAVASDIGLPFESVSQQALAAQSDVIISITSAHEPLLMCDWIKPGTHIACMGTDTVGKQEMDPQLFKNATVFTDEIAQSITLGEAQHAVKAGLLDQAAITPLGAVINGTHKGRSSATEITVFDGTGVGLQGLAVAQVAASIAKEQGAISFSL
jgi:alanine dehydrogenase